MSSSFSYAAAAKTAFPKTLAPSPSTDNKRLLKPTGRDRRIQTSSEPLATSTTRLPILPQSNTPTPKQDLPYPPNWVIGLLAGCLSFGLVLAIMLYLVNFPPTRTKRHNILHRKKKTQPPATKPNTTNENEEKYSSEDHNWSSALDFEDLPTTPLIHTQTATEQTGATTRNRKTKNLTINTSARYTAGLGITFPTISSPFSKTKARVKRTENPFETRNTENENTHDSPKIHPAPTQSPAAAAWRMLSAPLPPLPGFLSPYPSFRALESGSDSNVDVESGTGDHSPLSCAGDGNRGHGSGGRLLEGIGGAVESVAGRLAGFLADVVQDGEVEGGLVLPVRDEERECRTTTL